MFLRLLSGIEWLFPLVPRQTAEELGQEWKPTGRYYFLEDERSHWKRRLVSVLRLDRNAVSFWRRREEARRTLRPVDVTILQAIAEDDLYETTSTDTFYLPKHNSVPSYPEVVQEIWCWYLNTPRRVYIDGDWAELPPSSAAHRNLLVIEDGDQAYRIEETRLPNISLCGADPWGSLLSLVPVTNDTFEDRPDKSPYVMCKMTASGTVPILVPCSIPV